MDKNLMGSESTKIDSFKKELKSLLKKYDATICFTVGESSDTCALYEVFFETNRFRFRFTTESHELSKGWRVDAGDL